MNLLLRSLLVLSAWLVAVPATAQGERKSDELTQEQVSKQLAAIEANEKLDKDTKADAIAAYKAAAARLEEAESWTQRAAELRKLAATAAESLVPLKQQLAEEPVAPKIEVPKAATVEETEASLKQATTNLENAREQLRSLQNEISRRSARLKALPGELDRSKAALRDLEKSVAELPTTPGDPKAAAKHTLVRARRIAAASQVKLLEAEQASLEAQKDLLPARRDLAARAVRQAEALTTQWTEVTGAARKQAARVAAEKALEKTREAAHSDPRIAAIAARTHELTQLRLGEKGLSEKRNAAVRALQEVTARLARLGRRRDRVRNWVKNVGSNVGIGRFLLREIRELHPELSYEAQIEQYQNDYSNAQYQRLLLDSDRDRLEDIQPLVRELVDEMQKGDNEAERERLERVTRELLVGQRDLVQELDQEFEQYSNKLVELIATTRQLAAETREHFAFVLERVLWVRDIRADETLSLGDALLPIGWLFGGSLDAKSDGPEPNPWPEALAAVFSDPFWSLAPWLVVVVALVLLRPWFKRQIELLAERVEDFRTDSFRWTSLTLLWTVLLATPLPLLLYLVGDGLSQVAEPRTAPDAFAAGLMAAVRVVFALGLLRVALAPRGLARVHLRWPAKACEFLRRNINWYLPIVGVAVFLLEATWLDHAPTMPASLSRIVAVVWMSAATVFLYRVLRPSGPVLASYFSRQRGWIYALRYVWYAFAVALPAALALAPIFGYSLASIVLARHLRATIMLVLVLVAAHSLLLRWLFVARRVIAAKNLDDAGRDQPATELAEVEKADVTALSHQTRQLFRVGFLVALLIGLAQIWAGILPAFRVLDRIQVYPRFGLVDAAAVSDEPSAPAANTTGGSRAKPDTKTTVSVPPGLPGTSQAGPESSSSGPPTVVSLADVGLCILLFVFTVIAARNVPALLEIILLRRLPFDSSARYAISTVTSYIIVIVGVTVAFASIGISWSTVQWLAAALTFGLAFGLQEIFANFVSGLIILIERPIRLGDIVTVGNIDGKVTKIRIRATTVTDWSRKELLIPNKDFITKQLTNWTLSDAITRLVIPVTVAHGSDTDLVTEILLEVANSQSHVVEDPRPRALFRQFGENGLLFELRAYLDSMDHWINTMHGLHSGIDKRFREAGIKFALPRRDVSVDLPEPTVRLMRRSNLDPVAEPQPELGDPSPSS